MQRAGPALRLLQAAAGSGASLETAAAASSSRAFTSYTFSGIADAPPPAGSSAISVAAKGDAKSVSVDVKAGRASARASYAPSSIRKLQSTPLTLYDTPRISVLHASFMEHLLRLAHERYSLLAQWPDFGVAFSKEVYYRSHPEDLRKLYNLVDDWHRMWDAVTEFDSLSHLATQMVPGYRKRHMNLLGPAVGPTTANGVVAAFLLGQAK
ncbi:hypothetical protein Rsub_13084 [Raphidocelis subcapitata]|uniref:Uncharacterized protein n=1 Tax=Raphidocelis subcapitata TaxID=307507 RepID=A0A2V0PKM4_9CHLO|nr:hypothetical protein Rsub_13084 [Raphidocelis subcapitata]|eukprot:GBG00352.1 hypothetical protein Rsub_13084 [Raphidocelis subcapitata]